MEKEKAFEVAKKKAFEESTTNSEIKNRITMLSKRQAHIALLQIAEAIDYIRVCDIRSFDSALNDGETF